MITDDSDRLIQEVLSDLGWDEDPKKVADKVKRLDQGLPAEDEFTAICSWLGKAHLLHMLDQHQEPSSSRDLYQVPDLLAEFEQSGPVLIEVKSKTKQTLSFTPRYLEIGSAHTRSSSRCPCSSPGSTTVSGCSSTFNTSPRLRG